MAATRYTLKWVKNVYGGGAFYQEYPEGDSESYKKGAIVVYDESEDGIAEVARTSGVPDFQHILGLAQEDASGTSDQIQDIQIPRPGDVFEASVASDQDTVVAPTLDMVGDRVGLIKLSSTGGAGTEYVVHSGASNWAKIINVNPVDVERRGGVGNLSAGDRVLIQFLSTVLEADGSRD